MPRTASITRKTNETDITVELNLDPAKTGAYANKTGVGFFDHMLDHVARHGKFGLNVSAKGDTHIDDHHTVEDVGIVLGQVLEKALVPMDEALARVSIDLSGRAALVFDVTFKEPFGKIGTFDNQLVREFFNAVVNAGKFNCHIEAPRGENDHHIAEAIFKAFGRALRQAVNVTGDDVPSTKGSL
jgi:imidazoleglycerol-phosphate dehydratase